MTHEQQALWQRIRDFRIDAPNASFPYSLRLAREMGWTPAYARRVVDEYRRFAFLAAAAGHGVTPSKAVDEAWHLHLLYTRNYWVEFCGETLRRPLHHHPADGGEADDRKYKGWYDATLVSYERLFGEAPPLDVWPRSTPSKAARRFWPWLAIAPILLTGCEEPANPLDWHGPAFLQLFFLLYSVALGLALLLRAWLRGPTDGPPAEDWSLHAIEEAYLNEGERLALATSLTGLTAANRIEVAGKGRRLRAVDASQVGDHPLDRAVLRATASTTGANVEAIHRVVKPQLDEIGTSLRRQGLWTPQGQVASATLIPFTVATLPLLLGTIKIFAGLDRGRPVGFLVVGCIAAGMANLLLLSQPKRSRYGDAVLERLRARKSAARYAAGRAGVRPADLATGVALFGLTVLAGGPYDHLQTAFVPVAATGSGDGGASYCGGGSSCGGGCGGGGCGGCGS